MSLELLDKTRKINSLIMNEGTNKLDFNTVCSCLSEIMGVNIILFSSRGKVLGIAGREEIPKIPMLANLKRGSILEKTIANRFMSVMSTQDNINFHTMGLEFEDSKSYYGMISPILVSNKHLGTVLVYNNNSPYYIDDIILLEHTITVFGLYISMSKSEELMNVTRNTDDVSIALSTLSGLQLKAVYHILKNLNGKEEGRIVTSRLASEIDITRSVIINALKKCESAGIIYSHSAGVKGTLITITNELLSKEMVYKYINDNNGSVD